MNRDIQRIDYLNIGLMAISLLLASVLPFRLFLIVYAILGPLHYLTEIGWLRDRSYFMHEKRNYKVLAALCTIIFLGIVLNEPLIIEFTSALESTFIVGTIIDFLKTHGPAMSLWALVYALLTIIKMSKAVKWFVMLMVVIASLYLNKVENFLVWFGLFLPTIIHVSLFTALFVLYGALKNKQQSGYLSFLFFMICVSSIFLLDMQAIWFELNQYIQDSFVESNLIYLNLFLYNQFWVEGAHLDLTSDIGVKIQSFIAFSYTYHYLNWFSKTKIIKWHQVSRSSLITTLIIWVTSMGLYLYNYKLGLICLSFLSILHVFLEFPLNWISIRGIGRAMMGRQDI